MEEIRRVGREGGILSRSISGEGKRRCGRKGRGNACGKMWRRERDGGRERARFAEKKTCRRRARSLVSEARGEQRERT